MSRLSETERAIEFQTKAFRFAMFVIFIMSVIIAGLCVSATTCQGQEYVVDIDDGTALKGEGFAGVPPSYLNLIKVESRHSGDHLGSGSFLSDRLVLTCYHNVRGITRPTDKIGIHTTNGNVYWNTKVVHTHPQWDLALIYINDPIVLYHSVLVVQDDTYTPREVAGMGFQPSKNALVLMQGLPTGRKFGSNGTSGPVFREVSFRIQQGMSGGPMVDESMALVGVNVACGPAKGRDSSDTHSVMLSRIQSFLDSYKGPLGNLSPSPWDFGR